jgi:hypothetical protein
MEINKDNSEQKEKKVKKGPGVSDTKSDGSGIDIVDTSDYVVDKLGRKHRAHRIVFNKGEDDGKKGFNGVTEQMKKSFSKFVEQHTPELTEEQLKELEQELNEVLGKSAAAGDWIHDFVHSDNPKFAGKSKEKRKQMALAAYYSAQRNEELKGGQVKLDKNKNGKLDKQDFKLLRKEEAEQLEEDFSELLEAYDADDYEASSQKSQFGGHRAIVKHKSTGREIYAGGTAYKSAEHAKGEAETYRTHYTAGSGKMTPGANLRHDRAVSDYRKKAKEAGHLLEDWDTMLASVKKRSESEKKAHTKTAHDVKEIGTGTVYTKQQEGGVSKEFKRDPDAPKRGRGRPKKSSFGEAVEFLMSLDEETFDSLMEDGFDCFIEHYEQLDEISKATLGSYVKKATKSAIASRRIAADYENISANSRKPSMKAAATGLADKWKSRTSKRSQNIDKAVDRLSK